MSNNGKTPLEIAAGYLAYTKKERVALQRQSMPAQEAEARVHNFNEVPFGYTAEQAVAEANRCLQCKKATCIEGCPVNIDIPKFIDFMAKGRFGDAVASLKKDNMLPAICGRVCPQEEQCEAVCTTGKKYTPVAIGRLERFLADWERDGGEMSLPEMAPPTGKRVAVVGSGPAGLTAAGDLRRLGHSVTVYEAFHSPGGVLIYGIPEFRLPKEIVWAEVKNLEKMGVKFQYNRVVGQLGSVEELLEAFDAVFIATGAGLPTFMNIPGENLNGIYSANEFLTRINLMRAFEFPKYDTPIPKIVNGAVFGAGNVAMDAARTMKRLGAERVTLVYRRSRAEMPARNEEIEHAEEEGIEFKLLHNPVRFLGDENGRVTGAECLRMELGEPDASGRRRPVPIKDSEVLFPCDAAVIAIGNSPNPLIPKTTPSIKTGKWGNIEADPKDGKTSVKGVFAAGDIVLGAATVILAMGHARNAAKAIDEYLKTGEW